MTEEFIPYTEALALKELGFDEPCFGYFSYEELIIEGRYKNSEHGRSISSPLYQQAFRWLLDKHHLYGIVIPTVTMDWTFKTMAVAQDMVEVPPYNHVDAYDYSRREEAELACLIKLIEIVKNK